MIAHYLLTALRHFRRHKLTTGISVVGLTIGLTCFILAYAAVAYLQRSEWSFPESERLFHLEVQQRLTGTSAATPWSPGVNFILADLVRAEFSEFDAVARLQHRTPAMSVRVDSQTSAVQVAFADPELLDIFRFEMLRGGRDALAAPRSAVITGALAQRLFGSADPLGRTMLLAGKEEVQVRGVIAMPPQPSHFGESDRFPVNFEALVSMDTHRALAEAQLSTEAARQVFDGWAGRYRYDTYLRSAPGEAISPDDLLLRLERLLASAVPADGPNLRLRLAPVRERLPRHLQGAWNIRSLGVPLSSLILTLATLVLSIACLNSASLTTAVSLTRARETAVRRAIGGSARQVLAQHVTEAALMTCAAMLGALMFAAFGAEYAQARWGLNLFHPLRGELQFWSGIAALPVIVAGASAALPALRTVRLRPVEALAGGAGRPRLRAVSMLTIGAQFTMASALLIAVLAIASQNADLRRAALPAASDPVVVVTNGLREMEVDFETLRRRLIGQPGIRAVTARSMPPWAGYGAGTLERRAGSTTPIAVFRNSVVDGYFSTIGLPIIAGRDFDRRQADDYSWARDAADLTRPRRIILDRSSTARLGWTAPQDAVGERIYFPSGRAGGPGIPADIIGVVEDQTYVLETIGPTSTYHIFTPDQAWVPLVRIDRNNVPAALATIDSVWRQLAPEVPIERRFLDEQFEREFRNFQWIANALAGLSAMALLIAVAGLIGMTMHVINTRTHEIGVRKTLGASVARICSMLLKDLSRPVVIANVVAWPIAFVAANSYISSFAHRVEPGVIPYIAGLIIMIGVVALSASGQAVAAARVKPATTLRHE